MAAANKVSSCLPSVEVGVLRGHEGAVLAVRFNKDGNYCLTGGKDRTVRLWNPHKGLAIKSYLGHGREVRDIATSSDNSRLASVGGDRQPFFWDVSTGRVIRKLRGHDSEINAVRFNMYDAALVTASYDRTVRIWDCRSHSLDAMQVMDCFKDSVTSLAVTKYEIIAGSVDGSIITFDIRMGRTIADQLGHPVTSVSVSNDDNCILAGCLDNKLRLLDRGSGELLNEYSGHVNKTYKLDSCLTNTDAHVVSGSEDGRVCIWELVEAELVATVKAHASAVTGLSYHPSETCMLTCSTDGTARVWR